MSGLVANERIAAFLGSALEQWETPGLIISVVRDDELVLAEGYGTREIATSARPDGRTQFAIGSLSKAFGAAAIACLVEQGKIDWEDRVRTYLPWFELYDPWVSHEVRVRDLLAHRIGSDFTIEDRLIPVLTDGEDFVRRIRYLQPSAGFRSRYVYSNGMYVAAALLVEAVTGKSWAQFMEESIWRPLGMTDTTTDFRQVIRNVNHATPHWRIDGALHPLRQWEAEREAFDVSRASGAIISTAHDMAQWLRLQLGQGRYRGQQVIDTSVFAQMHTPHTPIRGGLRDVIYWFTHLSSADIKTRHWAYGLGWWVTDYRGRTLICHTGTAAGFRGAVLMLPQERLGVYVGVNMPTELPFAAALTALDEYLDCADVDWSALFLQQARERDAQQRALERDRQASRISNTCPSLPLERYAGTYRDNGALGEIKIRHQGSELLLTVGHEEGQLTHWHYDVFQLRWRGPVPRKTFLSFTLDSLGAAQSLHIEQSGTFTRMGDS